MGDGHLSLDLTAPKHGGDLAAWQHKLGEQAANWLDLSSACNREPWPIPELAPNRWMELPDPTCLLGQAQQYYGQAPLAIGAGSQQFIEILPLLLENTGLNVKESRVMVPRTGYQEHVFAWRKWGYLIEYYDHVEELLERSWQVAVVINPNNPTGENCPLDTLTAIVQRAEEMSAYVLVDEAFIDATPQHSLLTQFASANFSQYLFVFRSVGKFFGLAGARVGFLFAHASWQQRIRNLIGPWPVATPSLFLVGQALLDRQWQVKARQSLISRQKTFLERVGPKLNTIFDTQERAETLYFVTWQLDSEEYAEQVFAMLHQVGVHVRLGQAWIRVAIPAQDEIAILDQSLIRLLKGAGGRELA
ncbi:aminotransferase class I/II-fold pyridoxal phosphate-dependent enzyme [Marinomonas epiphytica]